MDVGIEGRLHVAVDTTAEPGRTYLYRLIVELSEGGGSTFGPITGTSRGLVLGFALAAPAPNPTTGETRIAYNIAREGKMRLRILDLQGRLVAALADETRQPGRYEAIWNGAGRQRVAPPGLYLVVLDQLGRNISRRLLLVR